MPHSVRSVPAQRPARSPRALERDRRAGHASDRRIALVVKRVVGHVVVLDVVPDLLFVPVGQRVELPEPEPLVPAELGRVGASLRVDPADSRDPAARPRRGPRASARPCGRRSSRRVEARGAAAAPSVRRSARTRSRSARRARRASRRSPGTAARCRRRRTAPQARSVRHVDDHRAGLLKRDGEAQVGVEALDRPGDRVLGAQRSTSALDGRAVDRLADRRRGRSVAIAAGRAAGCGSTKPLIRRTRPRRARPCRARSGSSR